MLFYSINTKLRVALGSDGVGRIKVLKGERAEKGSGPCSHVITTDQSPLSICSQSAALLEWQPNSWENQCYFRASHTDNVFTPQRAKPPRFPGDFQHRLNNQFRTVKELCNYCCRYRSIHEVLLNLFLLLFFLD